MACSHTRILLVAVSVLAVLCVVPAGHGQVAATRLDLTDADTGRPIASRTLADGEQVVLTWRNSLFGLDVTEVFVAGAGRLTLTSITFADPAGGEPPRVAPDEVDDLYHTGGPFRAEGLSRPIGRVVFRVGQIGNPALQIGDLRLEFAREVGFGGAVLMATALAHEAATPGPE
jgi:hypothetical protein